MKVSGNLSSLRFKLVSGNLSSLQFKLKVSSYQTSENFTDDYI